MHNVPAKKWFIHNSKTDITFIILCPLIAFFIVLLVCAPRKENYVFSELTPIWFMIMASTLTYAHVLLVFTRSHLNLSVFKRYKYRFTLIPVLFLLAFWCSQPFFIIAGGVAVYWDEWHSLMQTFGFGRIYDSKLDNDPLLGRKLDMGMAFVVGLLPHIILLTYLPKSQTDGAFVEYLEMPLKVARQYGHFITSARIPLILFGIGFSFFYCFSYYRLIKNGYKYSKGKLALFIVTGITTTLVATFFTISDGIFFGNIYHALQYIFIVYVSEKSNLGIIISKKTFGEVKESIVDRLGKMIYFLLVIPAIFLLAILRQVTEGIEYVGAFWLLTSLMHFWFDGFIWSVRRQDLR